MNLANNYYFWKNGLPKSLCNDIIKHALKNKRTRGVIGVSKSKNKIKKY